MPKYTTSCHSSRLGWDLTTAYGIYVARSSVIMEGGKDRAFSERYTSLSSAIGLQAASN